MTINQSEAKRRAIENWRMWRLLLSDMNITYKDLDSMDDDDIMEANAALDIHIEQQKNKSKK
ncbi:hypothetical protein HQN90_20390 [Paenibacillus alba]|uniref:hypothetical protein n=1 Tax=Paenibacillus alba TaxID=1197127 RepID=UPI0015650A74|nr:hypothetical protein [Paenibacillus alba]NQX68488.1 hypothetical protein [Paenibacillus alba]